MPSSRPGPARKAPLPAAAVGAAHEEREGVLNLEDTGQRQEHGADLPPTRDVPVLMEGLPRAQLPLGGTRVREKLVG